MATQITTTTNTPEDQIPAVPVVADSNGEVAPDAPDSYTTLPGDTWESIADGFGLDVDAVFDLNVGSNDIRTKQSIPVGAVIQLRAPVGEPVTE